MTAVDPHALGDPDAMRVVERSFRNNAEEIALRAQELERRFERLGFEGPAAARIRDRMLMRRRRAEEAARQLVEAANLLARTAAQTEDDLELLERKRRYGEEA